MMPKDIIIFSMDAICRMGRWERSFLVCPFDSFSFVLVILGEGEKLSSLIHKEGLLSFWLLFNLTTLKAYNLGGYLVSVNIPLRKEENKDIRVIMPITKHHPPMTEHSNSLFAHPSVSNWQQTYNHLEIVLSLNARW